MILFETIIVNQKITAVFILQNFLAHPINIREKNKTGTEVTGIFCIDFWGKALEGKGYFHHGTPAFISGSPPLVPDPIYGMFMLCPALSCYVSVARRVYVVMCALSMG